jgi:hypothetical protein
MKKASRKGTKNGTPYDVAHRIISTEAVIKDLFWYQFGGEGSQHDGSSLDITYPIKNSVSWD